MIGHASPAATAWVGRLRPLLRLAFRPRIEGLHHLPAEGPFMLVANHSAGLGLGELACFTALYLEAGPPRPLAGFAHPLGFRAWPVTVLHRHLGTVPSTYEAAYGALEAGVPLLVFPGGDHETLRPVWQAGRVDFGGRRGFARVAREAQVPVVPMGIAGSHFTAPMLWRARWLAWVLVLPRLLGIKRWGISLLGLLGAAALACAPWSLGVRLGAMWIWLGSPFALLPMLPWTIRFRVGPPLPVFAPDLDLGEARDRAQAAVQAQVSALCAGPRPSGLGPGGAISP